MKYCQYCGKELTDESRFCENCGSPCSQSSAAYTPPPDMEASMYAEEKQCIDNYARFLKFERLCWKIGGIVFTILGGLYVTLGLIMLATLEYLGAPYILGGLFAFLPMGIVSLNMVSKVDYYMETLYTDIRPTVTRCDSIGMLIFCVLFNEAAAAFYIVNFIRTKCNRAAIARIIRNQQGQ